jgi:hypothetical protein
MGWGLAEGGVGRGGEGRGGGWRWLLPPMQLPWPATTRGMEDAEDVLGGARTATSWAALAVGLAEGGREVSGGDGGGHHGRGGGGG